MQNHQATISVTSRNHNYNIYIGNLFNQKTALCALLLPLLSKSSTHIVLYDSNIDDLALSTTIDTLNNLNLKYKLIELQVTSNSKNLTTLEYILNGALASSINRKSVIIALGGGTTGDLAGFAAAILLRGISYINIPTTLLAMVDSSIGGKTGIDTSYGKNLIGAFYAPSAVIIDKSLLSSLSTKELLAGFAEVIKYGLIMNQQFWQYLVQQSNQLLSLNDEFLFNIIKSSCTMKQQIVEDDELENNDKRALLNFGHSFGHALEQLNNYEPSLLHGEAVAIGIVLAAKFSNYMGYINSTTVSEITKFIGALGLPISPRIVNNYSPANLVAAMQNDKKNLNQNLSLILLTNIGKAVIEHNIEPKILINFLNQEYN